MVSRKLGIDFGTSNSTCAVLDGGRARLVPLEGESLTLPSALFFCEDGRVLFGREGVAAYLRGEDGRFMRGLKSILGTPLVQERTLINGRNVGFVDIITIYMRHLKECADAYVGEEIRDVVLGRPVHFHDDDLNADALSEGTLRQVAENLGFENISFQYEPIAAAFAHERNLQKDQLALVVDLGGGTSDFTVIQLSPNKATHRDRAGDILATTGVRIGGTNFDQKLSLKCFMPHLGMGGEYRAVMDKNKILPVPSSVYHELSSWSKVNFAQTKKAILSTRSLLKTAIEHEKIARLLSLQEAGLGHAFLQSTEQAKIALTDADDVQADLSRVNLGFDVCVSRAVFEDTISEQIARISDSIDLCVEEAGVGKDMIGLVILTGGSSELPVVNEMVARKFPAAELSNDNKFGSVGLGLAYHAEHVE